MKPLTDVMKEAEDGFDRFLQGAIGREEWLASSEMNYCSLFTYRVWTVWQVEEDTALPVISIFRDNDVYTARLARQEYPDVVLYKWICPDMHGISGDIDYACALRGALVFP